MSNHDQTATGSSPLRSDSNEPSLSEAQPYRTPNNVTDGIAASGGWKSPLLWIIVAATAGFVIVGSFLLFTPVRDFNKNRRPVTPIPKYVEDFGMNRVPAEDFEVFEEPVMQPLVSETAQQSGPGGTPGGTVGGTVVP